MTMLNEKENEKEKNQKKIKQTSQTSGIELLEIPLEIGLNIINSIKSKTTELADSNLVEHTAQTINTATEFITENAGELLEGAKATGDFVGGVIDAVGDALSGLDV